MELLEDTVKVCRGCGEAKAFSEFRPAKRYRGGLNSQCRDCVREYGRTPKAKETSWDCHLRRTYGITAQERDQMAADQEGRCAICGVETDLHVDHDHVTNKVRGLLCGKCNKALGLFDDNPDVLLRAFLYLQEETCAC